MLRHRAGPTWTAGVSGRWIRVGKGVRSKKSCQLKQAKTLPESPRKSTGIGIILLRQNKKKEERASREAGENHIGGNRAKIRSREGGVWRCPLLSRTISNSSARTSREEGGKTNGGDLPEEITENGRKWGEEKRTPKSGKKKLSQDGKATRSGSPQ